MKSAKFEQSVAELVRDWADEHLKPWTDRRVSAFGSGVIEVRIREKDDLADTLVLRLEFNHPVGQVYLSNIMMPRQLRYRGIGKGLISSIFRITVGVGYPLFVTGLVPSFYRRLVQRGAVVAVKDDAVLITEQADLAHRHG